jgi:sodium bicarbonate transporter 10
MVNILVCPLQLKNGTLVGTGCDTPHYVPDVFLMSIVLFFGTFIISVQLKDFKNALFFPSKVRNSRFSANRILNI